MQGPLEGSRRGWPRRPIQDPASGLPERLSTQERAWVGVLPEVAMPFGDEIVFLRHARVALRGDLVCDYPLRVDGNQTVSPACREIQQGKRKVR